MSPTSPRILTTHTHTHALQFVCIPFNFSSSPDIYDYFVSTFIEFGKHFSENLPIKLILHYPAAFIGCAKHSHSLHIQIEAGKYHRASNTHTHTHSMHCTISEI